jgi:hypothetical protein
MWARVLGGHKAVLVDMGQGTEQTSGTCPPYTMTSCIGGEGRERGGPSCQCHLLGTIWAGLRWSISHLPPCSMNLDTADLQCPSSQHSRVLPWAELAYRWHPGSGRQEGDHLEGERLLPARTLSGISQTWQVLGPGSLNSDRCPWACLHASVRPL